VVEVVMVDDDDDDEGSSSSNNTTYVWSTAKVRDITQEEVHEGCHYLIVGGEWVRRWCNQ